MELTMSVKVPTHDCVVINNKYQKLIWSPCYYWILLQILRQRTIVGVTDNTLQTAIDANIKPVPLLLFPWQYKNV